MSPDPLPVHPLCDCPFRVVCPDSRQQVAHWNRWTGTQCWAYEMIARRRPDLLPRVEVDAAAAERAALQEGV